MQGREHITQAFSAEKHALTFTMGDIRAYSVSPHTSVREILLTYPVYTHYPSGSTDLHDQRLHYTWREKSIKTDSGYTYVPEIVMIYISNAWKYDSRDTIYPIHYETVASKQVLPAQSAVWVTVKAADRSIRHIAADHILYIETVKHSARNLVHTISETIMAKGSLPDFEKNYPEVFPRIHASYLVNPSHVKNIQRFFVILSDESRIPVPEKKYTCIKKLLLSTL